MRIGVLSDTHLKDPGSPEARRLFELVDEHFAACDLVVHAGDLTSLWVIDELEKRAPVRAVAGNMDEPAVREALRDVELFDADGLTVAVTHGWGAPFGLRERIRAMLDARGTRPDVVIFGHTHEAVNVVEGGIRWINPGSPTDRRFARHHTLAVLEVTGGRVRARIVRV